QGAVEIASKRATKFFIEMHSPPELPMEKNAELILNWCAENKYKAYYLKEAIELTSPEIIARRGKCHLLLLPAEENYPSYLKGIKQGALLPNSIN
ncbi:hypothetical protein, partial [Flavobacterium sp.]|uniref:hypothetical protein n=1 Tax=Flavobacterium sp. TaxID=239 RepID=UPI002608C03E